MSNRKEILIPKYAELISNISSVGFPQVFPSLEDIDVVDMLLLFNYYFHRWDKVGLVVQAILSN